MHQQKNTQSRFWHAQIPHYDTPILRARDHHIVLFRMDCYADNHVGVGRPVGVAAHKVISVPHLQTMEI